MTREQQKDLLVRLYRLQQDAEASEAGEPAYSISFDLDGVLEHYERLWRISHSEIQLSSREEATT